MAPPDGGLHMTLTPVDDIWSSDVSIGSPATGEAWNYNNVYTCVACNNGIHYICLYSFIEWLNVVIF